MRPGVIAFAIVLGATGTAAAYPQFQLSRDQTCSGCHLSPAGGGLLNENGLSTAESMSQYGTAPEFFYNKVPTPSWLELGGNFFAVRSATSARRRTTSPTSQCRPRSTPTRRSATSSCTPTSGARPPEWDGGRTYKADTYVWSREHYIETSRTRAARMVCTSASGASCRCSACGSRSTRTSRASTVARRCTRRRTARRSRTSSRSTRFMSAASSRIRYIRSGLARQRRRRVRGVSAQRKVVARTRVHGVVVR